MWRVPPETRCRFCRLISCCSEHRAAHESRVHQVPARVGPERAAGPPGDGTPSSTPSLRAAPSSSARKRKLDDAPASDDAMTGVPVAVTPVSTAPGADGGPAAPSYTAPVDLIAPVEERAGEKLGNAIRWDPGVVTPRRQGRGAWEGAAQVPCPGAPLTRTRARRSRESFPIPRRRLLTPLEEEEEEGPAAHGPTHGPRGALRPRDGSAHEPDPRRHGEAL